ncbi:MAG: hypothetical protein H5U26_07220 [Immundisolibacter sp.]|uniref:TorF family putative porin n=1 Tax=Immundisolibacter sp. TaxID=1934948 RepID=UPI0019A62311|nr:TorF family putative porin [Immundisolibacter sp.]MBC7161880.1 hypothetical protein [Immundisolibacter sp.]
MKQVILTSLAAAGLLAATGAAADITGNVGLTSDYVFRGISQTDEKPAIQGGLDYAHSSGAYAGVWASNVDFNDGDEAQIEIDMYAGMTGKIDDLGWKFGGVYYNYPGVADSSGLKYDYWEFGPTLTYPIGPATASLLVLWSPNFYNETGKGLYSELGLSAPIGPAEPGGPFGQFNLGGTFGHQDIERNAKFGTPDYNNWSVYASTTVAGVGLKLAYTDTELSKSECFGGGSFGDWCGGRAVFSVSKAL